MILIKNLNYLFKSSNLLMILLVYTTNKLTFYKLSLFL